jgi:predicted dehydrogenase
MEEPIHDSEIIQPVPVGLIADAEGARAVGHAVVGTSLEIVAQSGVRQAEGLPGAAWHDDARVMIAQSGIEALLLAASPRAAWELEPLAAERGLPIWRLPPLARNFAEASELVRRVRQRNVPYRVVSWWPAIAGDVEWALRWREGFKPLFTRVRIAAAGPPSNSWRASLGDGPGGVLATDGYAMLEALVAVRKLPERVSASVSHVRRRPGETPRETESVAVAILRYESATTTSVQAVWDIPPFGQSTEHHGPEWTVVLEPERVGIHGERGEVLEERRWQPGAFLHDELEHFAAVVRNPTAYPQPDATLERHLAVTALLQAIYLAAQTGQPETPRKFYEVQAWPEPRW